MTVTSVALGGFLAGFATDKLYVSQNRGSKFVESTTSDHVEGFLCKPGLPIFGTVSAASIVPAKTVVNVNDIPPEPTHGASRVSQVLKPYN